MIAVQKLSFTYPNGERQVLKNIGFSLSDHGLTALLGCNGAGKTTLFRCMLALETRYEGSILLDGREIRSYAPSELAGRIAHIPQIHYPGFNYSVRDMVLMGTTHQTGVFASPGQQQLRIAQEALEKLGIAHLADRGYTRLSGGEKQLVLIARALAQQARILLMDEPTSALDFGNQSRVMNTLKALSRKDYCVLMSTHNPQHALSFCDRVIAMADGCVCADGVPSEVMNGEVMQKLYSIPVGFADTPYGRIVLPKA